MKHSFKKLTAWLCCMAMLISFIPATALPVFADEAEAVVLTQTQGTLEAGQYVLEGDLTLDGTLAVAKNTEVVIDLAGNDITGSVYPFFDISGKLTITDSTATGTPGTDYVSGAIIGGENPSNDNYGMIYTSGGEFTLEGGKLTGYKHTISGNRGGAIAALGKSVVNINGGEITGNSAYRGGGVFVTNQAVANINGGAIYGNTASNYGGGVHADTKDNVVNVTGGIIRNNTASRGSEICMGEATDNVLNISGGTITSTNTGSYDGIYSHTGAVTISGGEINHIYWRGGSIAISGGEIAKFETGNTGTGTAGPEIAITGNPEIADLSVNGAVVAGTASVSELTEGAYIKCSSVGVLVGTDGTVAYDSSTKTFTYQEVTLPASGNVASDEYVLKADHVLTNTLNIKNGVDVVIDLAGKTISMPEKDGYYFDIAAGSKLTIKDSAGGGKVQFKNTVGGSAAINVNGTFVLEGGELNGWTRINDGTYGAGGMMDMWAGAEFIMTGGLITDCDCAGSSVIRTQGTGDGIRVTITGGEITGNNAKGSNILGISGTAADPAILTIGGDAIIADNTFNDAPYALTGTGYEIQGKNCHIVIEGTPVVGYTYTDGDEVAEGDAPYSSFTITGAPIVSGFRWSSSAKTSASITELEEGAEIKGLASLGASQMDETVEKTLDGSVYTYTYKVPTYAVTVKSAAGGSVEVDVTEGAEGATVTVTATPDEGYELEAILVNGAAIEGNTFAIVAGDNVVTATFVAVDVSLPTSGQVASGEYVLEGDHVLTGTLIFKGETVIDLAGNTITADAGRCFFNIPAGGHLTIKDSAGGGVVEFLEMASSGGISLTGTFTLEGGELTGWSRVEGGALKAGGFIDMMANSTFEMTGGAITGISAASSAVIRSHGSGITVDITGGEIVGNESGNGSILSIGKAGGQSWLHIGGDAVIADNTKGGADVPFNYDEISSVETIVTIDGNAFVEANVQANLGTSENAVVLESSQINISGAPYVKYLRADSSAKTLFTITELEDGAEIHTSYNFTADAKNIDDTVAVEEWKGESGNSNEAGKVYTWLDPATVVVYNVTVGEVANGTVTVEPAEGVAGTTVTVTATAAEGYELTAILVDGEAIEGNTFAITGDHEVTATFTKLDLGLPTSGTVISGEYVLEADHVLTNTLTIKADSDVVIDLAGKTITMPEADGYYFNVNAGGKLTIKDSIGGGKVQFKNTVKGNAGINVEGTFVLEGGELTGWTRINDGAYGAGGFINLWPGTVVKMTGGKITGADCSSAVVMRSQKAGAITVEITGGEISGNHSQGGNIIQVNGTPTEPAYLTIGGTAKVGGNTYGADNVAYAMTGTGHEIQVMDAYVTISGNAEVGCVYADGTNEQESATGAIAITGAPTVQSVRWSNSNETPATIKELTKGASIKSLGSLGGSQLDGTVEKTQDGTVFTYSWLDPATVVHAVKVGTVVGGTVTVEPAEGVIGTTVTVTATADEGYELDAILVDGEAIEGNTFAITGAHTVTANFKAVDVSLPAKGEVASGEYVLEGDHVLTGSLIFRGETVIDLAGNSITLADDVAGCCFFNIPATGKLTIKDSVSGGVVEFKEMTSSGGISLSGTFVLEGGELTGWSRAENGALKAGGFIDMFANSTFEMTGGVITGIAASGMTVIRSHGAGVTVDITGGEIVGNEASNGNIIQVGKAGGQSWLHIGGEAVILENTMNGEALPFNYDAITTVETIVTIDGNAFVEANINASLGSSENAVALESSQINISGAPYVQYVRADSASKTLFTITELEDGAEIHTSYGFTVGASNKDNSVAVEAWTGESGNANEAGKIYTWQDPTTVVTYTVTVGEVSNGTVTVNPAEGEEGTTVTVTATAAEGYELTAILVDGTAIEGNTFAITGNHVVTATFAEKVVEPEPDPEPEEPTGLPTSGVVAAGEYVLESDLVLTSGLAIRSEVVIDLAGHTITAPEGGLAFNLDKDAPKLTIKDSAGGGKVQSGASTGNPCIFIQKGEFILDGGEITGWNRAGGAGGMVYLLANTTFTMNGGKLTGASCAGQSAIRTTAGSTIVINGGEISGNTATGGAPITLLDGVTMTVNGGTFSGNSSATFGGVFDVRSGATLTITGGTFTNNTATKNGGVIYNQGTVAISGGTFTGNTADVGGVLALGTEGSAKSIAGINATVTGGTFTGNSARRGGALASNDALIPADHTDLYPDLTIGGTAVIKDNVCSEYGGNMYAYTTNLTIEGGTIGTAFKGEEIAKLSQSSNVWFRTSDATITGGTIEGLTVSGGTATISGAPKINEINATIVMSGLTTGASIRTAATGMVTVAEGDDTVYTINDRDFTFKGDMGLADKFVDGETLVLEKDESVGSGIVLAAGTYTLDLNGYTLSGNAAPYFTLGEGVELIVMDSSEAGTGKIVGIENATNAMILVNGGYFELNSGLLTGNVNADGMGGAIYAAKNGSYVCINGGEISGNTGRRGGAIAGPDTATAVDVIIEINGGIVTGNATNRGATMYTQTGATVIIAGGKVGYGTVNGEPADIYSSGKEDLWIRNSILEITGGDINGIYFNGNAANGYTMTISGATTIKALSGVTAEVASIGALEPGAEVILTGGALAVDEDDDTVMAFGRNYYYPGDVKSILFVGNSFSGDSTQYLNAVGSFYGKKIAPAYLYVGSQSIRNHAQSLAESLRDTDLNGDGIIGDSRQRVGDGLYTCAGFEGYVDIPTVMESTKWDYVVLQQGVEYVGFEGAYNSDVDFLIDYIQDVQPEAKIMFNQTWAVDKRSWSTQVNPDAPESVEAGGQWLEKSSYLDQFGGSQAAMYDAILRNTEKFFAGADARFSADVEDWFPIGIAIQTMRQNYTDSYLTRDGFHLSYNAGRMIAALTVFKTLFPDVDLTTMTAADMAGLFGDKSTDHLKDLFDPTEENVATLLAAVNTACANKATIVASYGEGTANKQFNPDGAVMSSNEFVAVYENVTEMGQVPVRVTDGNDVAGVLTDKYASTGAGKIVIYKNGEAVSEIDELWLEKNAGIVLTNRYENLDGTYYIIADPQAPQLAVVGSKLYMTFDVKLYTDDGEIINGGVYFTTSTDGVNWTAAVKVSDAPMAYGLTALSNSTLLLSVADTTTKVLTLSTAGAVTKTVELDETVSDVAFAEVDGTVWALTSNGAVYFSADKGASWTATGISAGNMASPDMVALAKKGVYVTWADEANCKIYGKVWSIDKDDTDTYGWNNTEGNLIADYALATAYAGKSSAGQPATMITSTSKGTHTKTVFVDGGKLESFVHGVATSSLKTLALESSLTIIFKAQAAHIEGLLNENEGATVKFLRHYADPEKAPEWTSLKLGDEHYEPASGSNPALYAVPYTGVAAKEMGDDVYFALFDSEGNQITMLEKYSVLAYAEQNMPTKQTEFATLLVDMLNYGAAAQVRFSYDVANLVNAGLTETQKSWASADITDIAGLNTGYSNSKAASMKAAVLESAVVLKLQYSYTAGNYKTQVKNAAYASVTYTTHAGEAVEKTVELVAGTAGGSSWDVYVDFLATADMRTPIVVKLHNADGSEVDGTEMIYTVGAYAYSQLKNGYDESNDLHVLVMRMMQYGDAAYAFKH